jgi:hypothetical protein
MNTYEYININFIYPYMNTYECININFIYEYININFIFKVTLSLPKRVMDSR